MRKRGKLSLSEGRFSLKECIKHWFWFRIDRPIDLLHQVRKLSFPGGRPSLKHNALNTDLVFAMAGQLIYYIRLKSEGKGETFFSLDEGFPLSKMRQILI